MEVFSTSPVGSGGQAMAWTKVATVREVPVGQGRQVTVNGRKIALFNVGSSFYAIDDTCPHRGASLWEGELNGREVICPWHGAGFDVTTGAHLCPPARSAVTAYKVQVVGEEVQIDVPG
jgi:nitrite reductase/ring-hydroxylating ferredoxin subunit